MNWKVGFYEAVKNHLNADRDDFDIQIKQVLDVRQETRQGGYCETCWFEEEVLVIKYIDMNDNVREETESISFSEFMRSL